LALFRNRFESDDADERDKFLKLQKFGWGKVTDKEKEGIVVDLRKCLPRGTTREQVEAEKWFKVSCSPHLLRVTSQV
jgi:DNA primase large subunit